MTDIVNAPPFMPSKPQWDATVKLLERALEELAQAQAERDAARADVARMTAALERIRDTAQSWEGRSQAPYWNLGDIARAALRGQPAPAGCPECGHPESEHKHGVGENGPELFCGAWGCACVRQPAPAQDDARAAMIEILEDEPGPAQGQE